MKKKLLIVFAVLVALVLVAVGVGLMYLGPLIKKGVETVGPMVTKVDVKLASANVSLLGGSGSLKGLVVGNPPGYKSDAAMKLGEVSLSVAPGSLFGDKVHIKSIAIVGPEINLEGGLTDNNLSKILANVKSFSGPAGTNAAATTPTQSPAQKKFQLDSFVLKGAKLNANLNLPNLQPINLTLPDIELSNLGQGPEGITAADLTARAMNLVMNKALEATADYATKAGKQALENAARNAADKALKGSGDKATKSLNDLFKK